MFAHVYVLTEAGPKLIYGCKVNSAQLIRNIFIYTTIHIHCASCCISLDINVYLLNWI